MGRQHGAEGGFVAIHEIGAGAAMDVQIHEAGRQQAIRGVNSRNLRRNLGQYLARGSYGRDASIANMNGALRQLAIGKNQIAHENEVGVRHALNGIACRQLRQPAGSNANAGRRATRHPLWDPAFRSARRSNGES